MFWGPSTVSINILHPECFKGSFILKSSVNSSLRAFEYPSSSPSCLCKFLNNFFHFYRSPDCRHCAWSQEMGGAPHPRIERDLSSRTSLEKTTRIFSSIIRAHAWPADLKLSVYILGGSTAGSHGRLHLGFWQSRIVFFFFSG